MTQQSTQGSDRVDWLVEHYLRQTFETVCDIIRRGQAAGRVRGDDPQRLYYAIIALGGTPTSVAREFQLLTGRDLFADAEVRHTVRAVFDYVFV